MFTRCRILILTPVLFGLSLLCLSRAFSDEEWDAYRKTHPVPFVKGQETSADFVPNQKRFQWEDRKNPNVLSSPLIRKLSRNQNLLKTLIDPNQGIWFVDNFHGEEEAPHVSKMHHIRAKDLKKELPSLLSDWRDHQAHSDDIDCHNNVRFPYCSIRHYGEWMADWEIMFVRKRNGELVFWGVLIQDDAHLDLFSKEDNPFLKKLFEKFEQEVDPLPSSV